jgi:hypothetical protein
LYLRKLLSALNSNTRQKLSNEELTLPPLLLQLLEGRRGVGRVADWVTVEALGLLAEGAAESGDVFLGWRVAADYVRRM